MKSEKTLFSTQYTDDTLKDIIHNDDIIIKALGEKEKIVVLFFDELKKAIDTDNRQLLLDCNYSKSKFKDSDTLKVDYFRVIDTTTNTSLIQVYTSVNLKAQSIKFALYTSSQKNNKALFDKYNKLFNMQYLIDKKTQRIKTSYIKNVEYNDIKNYIINICNVLSQNEKALEKALEKIEK